MTTAFHHDAGKLLVVQDLEDITPEKPFAITRSRAVRCTGDVLAPMGFKESLSLFWHVLQWRGAKYIRCQSFATPLNLEDLVLGLWFPAQVWVNENRPRWVWAACQTAVEGRIICEKGTNANEDSIMTRAKIVGHGFRVRTR